MKLAYWAAGDRCKRKYIRLMSISNVESDVTFKNRCFLKEVKQDSIPILNLSVDIDENDCDKKE